MGCDMLVGIDQALILGTDPSAGTAVVLLTLPSVPCGRVFCFDARPVALEVVPDVGDDTLGIPLRYSGVTPGVEKSWKVGDCCAKCSRKPGMVAIVIPPGPNCSDLTTAACVGAGREFSRPWPPFGKS